MSSTGDELDRHEAAKRATSPKPTICLACGNTKLPHVVTPGCLSCQVLARDWDGLGQAEAEMNAGLAEASGWKDKTGPIPIEARILKDLDTLDKYNPTDWPEIREHWRRERFAGLNRVPVTGPALTLIGGGLLAFVLLPTSVQWIGLTVALFGFTYWLAPWWWWK